MNGLHLRRNRGGFDCLTGEVMKNSTTFNIGDPVTVDTNGFLLVAAAGNLVAGVANEYYVSTSDNQTVAGRKLSYIPANPADLYEADMSAAVAATNRKQRCDLTGATGAVKLDFGTVGDTGGQFVIQELDPRGESSTTRVLCSIAELQDLAYAQV